MKILIQKCEEILTTFAVPQSEVSEDDAYGILVEVPDETFQKWREAETLHNECIKEMHSFLPKETAKWEDPE
jgi:hypothetical protein